MSMTAELTERQAQIAALGDQGKTPREIAEALGITEGAVYQHFRRMRERKPARKAPVKPRRAIGAKLDAAPRSEPVTPLDAVRARRDAINATLEASKDALDVATQAVEVASAAYSQLVAEHFDEMRALDIAEKALTGELTPETPAPVTPKGRRTKAQAAAEPNGQDADADAELGALSQSAVDAEFATP